KGSLSTSLRRSRVSWKRCRCSAGNRSLLANRCLLWMKPRNEQHEIRQRRSSTSLKPNTRDRKNFSEWDRQRRKTSTGHAPPAIRIDNVSLRRNGTLTRKDRRPHKRDWFTTHCFRRA